MILLSTDWAALGCYSALLFLFGATAGATLVAIARKVL